MAALSLAVAARAGDGPEPSRPAPEERPFLLGGIQVNEDDHQRWAAALIRAGMNAVEVTAYAHQGPWDSSELWFADEEPAVLAEIRAALQNGLQVFLLLRVALDHNFPENRFLWHGLIFPRTDEELAEWFRRYTEFVLKWARIAQREGVQVLGLAGEMNSLGATLPAAELPELAVYYLDDGKLEELTTLIGRYRHRFGEDDRVAMGAGDFSSLEEFLVERNRAERRWARAYSFAGEEDRLGGVNRRRRLLLRHWEKLIAAVREVYGGRLTFAANFDNYHEVAFWDRLDLIGINAYFPLRKSLERPLREADLTEAWRGVFGEIEAFRKAHSLRQPVLFTELGYTRRSGVTVAPWSSQGFVPIWDPEGDGVLVWTAQPFDPGERALAVRALFSAQDPERFPFAGFFYWKLSSRLDLQRYEPFMLFLGAEGRDPLFEAVRLFAALARPLDPPAGGGGEPPLLHHAVRRGRGTTVRSLLDAGADTASRDRAGYLPLHWACYQEDPLLVAAVLPPPDVSWRDEEGETPFHKCARLDNAPVLEELLRHRPELAEARNGRARTALWLAADQASPQTVGLLIRHDGDAGRTDEEGAGPLHVAAARGDPAVVELLLRTFDREARNRYGSRPVNYAAYYGRTEAFRMLWRPADPPETDAGGQSLLHHAAHGGRVEILRALLERGHDVSRADRAGRTPLHLAVMQTHVAAVRLLLDHGAETHRADGAGLTALHVSAARKSTELLELLLARAPSLDPADAEGNTPLHLAASWGRVDHLRLLLAAGARSDLRNLEGLTPLEVAERFDRLRAAELLREWTATG